MEHVSISGRNQTINVPYLEISPDTTVYKRKCLFLHVKVYSGVEGYTAKSLSLPKDLLVVNVGYVFEALLRMHVKVSKED